MPYQGRNRRYYSITEEGRSKLEEYRTQWLDYKHAIDTFLDEKTGKDPEGRTEEKMNRREFIARLKEEISRLPQEEIEAAVEYYEEYFDEAGADKEQDVLERLGSPKKVASQIKVGICCEVIR